MQVCAPAGMHALFQAWHPHRTVLMKSASAASVSEREEHVKIDFDKKLWRLHHTAQDTARARGASRDDAPNSPSAFPSPTLSLAGTSIFAWSFLEHAYVFAKVCALQTRGR